MAVVHFCPHWCPYKGTSLLYNRLRGKIQRVEERPRCPLSPWIGHEIRRFWDVSSPICGRYRLGADFFQQAGVFCVNFGYCKMGFTEVLSPKHTLPVLSLAHMGEQKIRHFGGCTLPERRIKLLLSHCNEPGVHCLSSAHLRRSE